MNVRVPSFRQFGELILNVTSFVPGLRRTGGTPRRTDMEFLPAALEILETPPSPVRMALIIVICAFVTVALIWSYVSRVDVIAVAQGKLQPTGRIKVIQPLETSRVLAIDVQNGDLVKAGQVLVELDTSEAAADRSGVLADLTSYEAEVLRRQAAIDAASRRDLKPTLAVAWPERIPQPIRQREERVYAADVLQLSAQVAGLRAQMDQKSAEVQRIETMISAQTDLIATLQQRVSMRDELVKMNAGSKSNLIDATETLQYQKMNIAQQRGQLAEANANLKVIARDIQRTYDTFMADNAQKLADAERQAGDLREKLKKAESRVDHMTLRSPIDGVIQASTLTTIGQIVTTGQELMRVVPDRNALEIECYLPNRDIGFVKPGDHAVIKIEAFPFTRYGTIDAKVVRVARDAIPEPEAEQAERDATRSGQSLTASGGERTQNLVFPVTLVPASSYILVDDRRVPLGAGMAVTAEIRTGSRRMLEYVFSPLVKVGSEAMRER
jgi:hemolysin D